MKRDFSSHLYLGNHYKQLHDYEKAEHHYRIAKSIAPNNVEVLTHLCAFCHHMYQFDLSFKCAELAVKNLEKPNAEVYLNYAILLGDKGESEKSQYYFYKAISANLNDKQALFGLGMEQIRNKKYVEGWENYEARLECYDHLKEIEKKYNAPYWDGTKEKRIVLFNDQGLGDFIFGLRYLPELANKKIQIYIDSDFDLTWIGNFEKYKNQEVDCCCSVMSLPHLTDPQNFCTGNYQTMLKLKKHNTKNKNKKVGIIFAGNPKHDNDYKRSIKLSYLKPILEKYDCYLLEKTESYKRWHMSRHVDLYDCEFGGTVLKYENISQALEFLYQLDCLVTVDTGLAHLAGAIQMPTYVLLDYSPDFRWGMTGDTTSYYPSWHLCRQKEPHKWEDAVKIFLNKLN
jgi:tetratricopeptide (TPR) repeat protein